MSLGKSEMKAKENFRSINEVHMLEEMQLRTDAACRISKFFTKESEETKENNGE